MSFQPKTSDWRRLGPVLLVGHRGAGKSTLGRRAARRLERPFVDLDDEIDEQTDEPIEELVEHNPEKFRRVERDALGDLCELATAPIIACGAGIEPIPPGVFTVWIDRRDWREEVRNSKRPRVRPDLSVREEWKWMEKTRRPSWLDAAHLRLSVPRGREASTSAAQLAALLRWSAVAAASPVTRKTWLVPNDAHLVSRAIADMRHFGLAGVELRSDVFSGDVTVPDSTAHLASVRDGDPSWLANFPEATAWDVDIQFADDVPSELADDAPERIIVSAHPDRPRESDFDRLRQTGRELADTLGLPERRVELKYVPHLRGFGDVDELLDLLAKFRRCEHRTTVLTRPRRFAWLRPLLLFENAANYLPVGLRERSPEHPAPLDFCELLPHLAGPPPRWFDALIGDPVDQSRGDLWHRRRSLRADSPPTGYLKIPVARGEFDAALRCLERLPIRGVSVTSPLKVEAAESGLVANPADLPALNTLVHDRGEQRNWCGTDTDRAGVEETLKKLETEGIGPGRAVVFGRGGASYAVLRGLRQRGWTIAEHISARAGWRPEHAELDDVDLVVNAAGPKRSRSDDAPRCLAWFDLHYVDVVPPPVDAVHVQGDRMFEAQAEQQRAFWA